MKKLTYLFCFSVFLVQLTSCTVVVPHYTTVDNLTRLNPGMSKQQALTTLDNLYPYDIMNGVSETCEIHVYKYKHPKQSNRNNSDERAALRGGVEKFGEESEAYIIYKNGLIYSVITNAGQADFGSLMASIKTAGNACADPVELKGCTDPTSLNYNPNAIVDDGSCSYCDCGYVKNPNYNPARAKSECNQPCIKADSYVSDNCDACDVIDMVKQGKANVNINFNVNEGSTTKKVKTDSKSTEKDDSKKDNDKNNDKSNNKGTTKTIKVY